MKKFLIPSIVLLLVLSLGVVLLLRLSKSEDTWLCTNGEWVKHGNPSSPKPSTKCETDEEQTYDVRNEDPGNPQNTDGGQVACTQDAKQCPDGSYVSRIPPNCEFAECTTTNNPDDENGNENEEIDSEPISIMTDPDGSGWNLYTDSTLGFSIKFPDSYKVVEDKYGWPDAVAMFYNGGQSYDLVIEKWNSQAEYESKYNSGAYTSENLTVKKVGNNYITLLNMNFDDEVDSIIDTFTELE